MQALTRRKLLVGSGTLAGAFSLGLPRRSAAMPVPALRGQRFQLDIGPKAVNFTGTRRIGVAINGSIPAPTLHWREGDTVHLRVQNHLQEDSSIHWHGILLPSEMDGVPGLSFGGIRPGAVFDYRFQLRQSGTYWYHSHSGFQEQQGMYGAIVVEPRTPEPFSYQRDYPVVLSDWSDENPLKVYYKLKKSSHYYNLNERVAAQLWRDIRAQGVAKTLRERAMWNRMRMSDRDISDVTGATYTFLMNGATPADNWTAAFQKGEKLRLRFINAAAMSFFDVRIPGLPMTVVAADGQNIEPVTVDEFRMGVAETYDVIVAPDADRAYTVFAQAIDRSGFARGTLTPDPALRAEIPALDPVPVLSHADMGMGHGGHHAGHGKMRGGKAKVPGGEHDRHRDRHEGQVQANPQDGGSSIQVRHTRRAAQHGALGRAGHGSTLPVVHPSSEYGPHVDMHAEHPGRALDDPGVGLRRHRQLYGRRVLRYSDLKNLYPTADAREPEREIQLHLTGNMMRYTWSIDGIKFADAEPIRLRHGERVRFSLVNDTMMNHPIHLHGLWSELETGDGAHIPRKHTLIVQPGTRIDYLVSADTIGRWAYHCHLLYHMPGMFREVRVRPA